MAKKNYTPEETDLILQRIETLVSDGLSVSTACQRSGVSLNTYYRWRRAHNGLPVDPLKRLRELERENLRLKRAVADLTVEMLILKESVSLNDSPRQRSAYRPRIR